MIRKSRENDFDIIYEIINDAAFAYKNIIPSDRWKEPYMTKEELEKQINDGVIFYCYEDDDKIIGVMGIQDKKDVKLIRHAYVRTEKRKSGIGTKLLKYLSKNKNESILIGTWRDAIWAIKFYEKNGFSIVEEEEKNNLLKRYWGIPKRQIETSVVLVNKYYKIKN